MYKKPIIALLLLTLSAPLSAQNILDAPKREVRAVWVTTYSGLDWPKTKASSTASIALQQQELCRTLDQLQAANINTVLFQTRVRGTVMYPSQIEPWDGCLTGTPGKDPGYDPLNFAINECHKRGMELHAWVVTVPCFKKTAAKALGKRSVLHTHPSLCREAGDSWYLDPGVPGTDTYLANICKEITERYDIDGIHLDYIRYPEVPFNDNATYKRYGKGENKAQWRRNNINNMVKAVSEAVKTLKPWVKLSSSPVGKYSDLSRYSSYGWNARDAVFQDAQQWVEQGWQDMLFPMMYFRGDHFYPFAADWQENCNGRPVVPGLGIYFLSPSEKDWSLETITREMQVVRRWKMGGTAYFRSKFLTDNVKGLYNYLRDCFYERPALTPAMTWQNTTLPEAPSQVEVQIQDDGIHLSWQGSAADGMTYYNVYGANTQPVDITSAENLLAARVPDSHFTYSFSRPGCQYWAITAVNRYGTESAPAQAVTPGTGATMGAPLLVCDGQTVFLDAQAKSRVTPAYHVKVSKKKYATYNGDVLYVTDMASNKLLTHTYTDSIPVEKLKVGCYQVVARTAKGVERTVGYFKKNSTY